MANANTSLEDFAEEYHALIEAYQSIEGSFTPANILEAIEGNWEELVDCIEPFALGVYAQHHKTEDRQRVMFMRDAIHLIQDFEEDLVQKTVLDYFDLLWLNLSSKASMILWIVQNSATLNVWQWWDAIKAIWQAEGIWKRVLIYSLEIIAISELILAMKKTAKVRETWEQKARGKALPQSEGPRYRRRKVTTR